MTLNSEKKRSPREGCCAKNESNVPARTGAPLDARRLSVPPQHLFGLQVVGRRSVAGTYRGLCSGRDVESERGTYVISPVYFVYLRQSRPASLSTYNSQVTNGLVLTALLFTSDNI